LTTSRDYDHQRDNDDWIDPNAAFRHTYMLTRPGPAAHRWSYAGRAVAFLAIAVALTAVALFLLSRLASGHIDMDHPSIRVNLVAETILLATSVVLPSLLIWFVTRESVATFGWTDARRGRPLLIGLCGGFCAMALLIALMALAGAATFGLSPVPVGTLAGYGAAYAAIFLLTGLSEEGLLRGYVLIQLGRAVGFWPAAIITSVIFAGLHLVHGNETVAGLLQVGLFGLVMAISVLRTGSIWLAVGFHAAWDFTETFVFGVADSGMSGAGSLIVTRFDGAAWLTGGSVGPEGSLLVFPLLVLVAALFLFGFRGAEQSDYRAKLGFYGD
jgi:membrane protease YdiL (CAAX protease family)